MEAKALLTKQHVCFRLVRHNAGGAISHPRLQKLTKMNVNDIHYKRKQKGQHFHVINYLFVLLSVNSAISMRTGSF